MQQILLNVNIEFYDSSTLPPSASSTPTPTPPVIVIVTDGTGNGGGSNGGSGGSAEAVGDGLASIELGEGSGEILMDEYEGFAEADEGIAEKTNSDGVTGGSSRENRPSDNVEAGEVHGRVSASSAGSGNASPYGHPLAGVEKQGGSAALWIASLLFVILVVFLILSLCKKKRRDDEQKVK